MIDMCLDQRPHALTQNRRGHSIELNAAVAMVLDEPAITAIESLITRWEIGERFSPDIGRSDRRPQQWQFDAGAIATKPFGKIDLGHVEAARVEITDVDWEDRLLTMAAVLRRIPNDCRGIEPVKNLKGNPKLVENFGERALHGVFLRPNYKPLWLIRPIIPRIVFKRRPEKCGLIVPARNALGRASVVNDVRPRNLTILARPYELLETPVVTDFDMFSMSFATKSR